MDKRAIRQSRGEDFARIYFIINEAAKAYQGVIPPDCYRQPYMSRKDLEKEIGRITFYGWEESGELVGVMGIEPVKDVTLIRHAYILPEWQRHGIGRKLLIFLMTKVRTPRLLVGTWAAVWWAVAFYEKHGFKLTADKDELLRTYWDISERQVETSVVLEMAQIKS